jgi:septal ring factor EnvC (AmiA/AmiB activator)
MKRLTTFIAALALGLSLVGAAHAGQDDIDIGRLNSSLDQLANDPTLGIYAQAEQARARDAINRLAQAGRHDRPHALYLAERRVDLAKTAAQLQDAQNKLSQLDREHDQILLENSRRDAERARMELERQRLQYQLAQEETARLQQQGEEASQAADQARAEADQAKKLAAAQSRVAKAARREAALASEAAKAMRSQMQDGSTPAPASKKKARKPHDQP